LVIIREINFISHRLWPALGLLDCIIIYLAYQIQIMGSDAGNIHFAVVILIMG